MKQGYVQVYTGQGKGKTTAALGLAMRVAGAGYNVFIGQFVKGQKYSELNSFSLISDQITIRQYGTTSFIYNGPSQHDIQLAKNGLCEIQQVLLAGQHKLVIMDEANIATFLGLFDVQDLIDIINIRPDHVELVITGRYADRQILELADLVTEMREVKHYYNVGVTARCGIEN